MHTNDFYNANDKLIQVIIGTGFMVIALFYAFCDGVRFLKSNLDRTLYFISCLLQKPILLPLLLPQRFRSKVEKKRFTEQEVASNNNRPPQKFVLAVQEANFFYSFTLSAFIAAATLINLLDDGNFEPFVILLLVSSSFYFLYGIYISCYLYGRKVPNIPLHKS